MKKNINILKSAENYINKHDEGKSVEELFIEFQNIVDLHIEFEKYLKEQKLNQNLEKMKRNERSLARRKMFSEWYFTKTQNDLGSEVAKLNISEMTFVSTRSASRDISYDTTA